MQFQTPPPVASYMASLMPNHAGTILEPTPGLGNLVKAAQAKGIVIAPPKFQDIPPNSRFDWAIMNPPFTPMKEGYHYLNEVMAMTDNIIALLPWLTIINSEKRTKEIMDFGLVSITHLPRKTFPGSRVQCCILWMKKGYKYNAVFNTFNWPTSS